MPETTQMGIMSLIPLTITLVLAFWKKDAIFALLIGCLSGVLLLGMDPAFGFSALAEEALGRRFHLDSFDSNFYWHNDSFLYESGSCPCIRKTNS